MAKLTLILSVGRRTWLFVATFFSLFAVGASASAQSCTTDADCQPGFACVASDGANAPLCNGTKGTNCPVDAAAAVPVVYLSCQPKMCNTDADCGEGMVCHQQKSTTCSGSGSAGSACPPNTKCDAGPVIATTETCTTTTYSLCAYRWQLPCSADSDCGAGFVCAPSVSVGCVGPARGGTVAIVSDDAGSSSPPAIDGGTPGCVTTTSFPGSCTPSATTCTIDSDCPTDWTCATSGTVGPVTSASRGISVGDDASPPSTEPVDAAVASTKVCVSPIVGVGAPVRAGDQGDVGGQVTGSSTGQGGEGTPSPSGDSAGGATGSGAASSLSSGWGCAVAPETGGSAAVLMAFALFGLVIRRRSSRK